MPVLKHFMGNCHVYVDRAADLDMAERIVVNAKCQRPGVCNAAESLLVHADVAAGVLAAASPPPCAARASSCVAVRPAGRLVADLKPASDEDLRGRVSGPDPVGEGRRRSGGGDRAHHPLRLAAHRTASSPTTCRRPSASRAAVDSAAVMVNASTRFNDGFELGLGAEIGISTDKFHARGPCGLQELCSYKYLVLGDGQVRE